MKDEIKEIFELYEKQATNPDLVILIKTLKEWYFEKEDYKSRNEKAIEYIEKCRDYHKTYHKEEKIFPDEIASLLMILQGEDKYE